MANITQIDLGVITPIPKGEYNPVTDYERLNFVTFNGSSWIRTDIEPYVVGSIPQTGSLYWQLNASGISEIPDASLIVKGITKLSNATNSVDETVAATSRAVKSAYDIGSTAVSNATTANNTANSALSIANTAKAVTDKVSTTPAAGKIPLADSTGKIDENWMDWSAWATGLAGKANTDLSNCTKPYITETWKSSGGSSWYRKYSDGWVEQGGRTSKFVLDESKIINFNHAFSDTNYTFITSSQAMDSETTVGRIGIINKTLNKTYAIVTSNGWTTNYTGFVVLWYACGY